MLSYLLEIGCEELPARFIPLSIEYLKTETTKQLNNAGLVFSSIKSGGTPRRLYLNIDGLHDMQTDKTEIIMGPPAKIAFNEDGSISEVGKKFVESKGLDINSAKKITTPKGDYLQAEKRTGGESAESILKRITPEIIRNMTFPKSMKWGDNEFRFARPIHSFLSLLNGQTLDFEVDNLKSGNISYGHRFLSPDMIIVTDFAQYKKALKNAYVIIDAEDRRQMIIEQLQALAGKENVEIHPEETLLQTVTDIVEYPHAIMGHFDEEFLKLPEEVLITSMKVHQKYFPVRSKDGKLLNSFVGVANIIPPNGDELIRQGFERVLKARLNDAVFFYENDKKVTMEDMVEKLKKVIYQEKLGTSYEKMERFRKLSISLAEKFDKESLDDVTETATLAKADLMSEMVYEFPELQGVMGSYYAKNAGKKENIAKGIHEHYLPKFAGDALPTFSEGRFVSIADKIDTIAGAFASGMIPTGNLDPYGLRRSAIGILSIIEDAFLRIDLEWLIGEALDGFSGNLKFNKKEVSDKILSFIMQRYKQMLVSKCASDADVFDAVSVRSSNPITVSAFCKVITSARGSEEFTTIAASFKRINNILKKSEWNNTNYSETLFETDEERSLDTLIKNQRISELVMSEKNYDALDELLKFAPALSAFFEKVMVMADDKKIRENRLGLISKLRSIFLTFGNFDAISQ